MTATAADSPLDRLARAALVANASVCFSSLLGAWALTHGITPPQLDLPLWITALGVINVLTAFVAALADALAGVGPRRTLPLLLLSMGIALSMELSGTALGIPFGRYEYSRYLGWKMFGLVPIVMPLTWFSLIHPSMEMASRLRLPRAAQVVSSSIILLLADVPMDPAMTAGFACWTWNQPGSWYGMPLSNWLGWLLVGLLVAALFGRVDGNQRMTAAPRRVAEGLYLLQGTFMSLLAIVYHRPGAAIPWFVGIAVLGVILKLRSDQRLIEAARVI